MKEALIKANQDGRALAGLVVLGWEDACAYVEAAEETGIPIILQAGPGCREHTPIPVLGKMFRHLADQASVPVICHIDHGYTIDECRAGIESGFTSVMFDGSKLPIDENIEKTAHIVELAKPHGISVEGEVGFVGYAEGANSAGTVPAEAERFDKESGADCMAISIGNVHLKTEKTAGMDFDLLSEIEAVTTLPLVLHGGSGIPVADRQKLAREHRIAKFNIGTELRMAFGNALRKSVNDQADKFDRIQLLKPTVEPVKLATIEVIKALHYPAGETQ